MELRLRRAAGTADLGDGLALLDRVALLHEQLFVVAVGSDVAAGMLDQQQVAHAGDLAAGIDDLATLGRLHRRALGRSDVDAVVLLAARRAVARDDLAVDRPHHLPRGRRGRHGDRSLAERRGFARGRGGARCLALALRARRRRQPFTLHRGRRVGVGRDGLLAGRLAVAVRHEAGPRHGERLAGLQRVGCLEIVAIDDGLRGHAVAARQAVDRVLVLHDIDRNGIGAGGGPGILHGAFAGTHDGVAGAERDRQHRHCTQRMHAAGPSRGEARGVFHASILLH